VDVSSVRPARLRADVALALAIAVGVVVMQAPFRLFLASLLDEGLILQIADDLLHGKQLYVDAVHYAFPGIFYLTAAVFWLFGTSMETARWLTIGLFALACAVAYLIARWWYTRRSAVGVVVLFLIYRVWAYPHWQVLNYSTLAVVLALAATWVAGQGLSSRLVWPYAIAGALAGGAVLAKQDSGAATAVALGMGVLICRPIPSAARSRRVLAFAAGVALILGAAAGALWHAGVATDLVRETILAPLYGVAHFAYLKEPALWPLVQQDPALRRHLFSYAPPVVLDLYWPQILQNPIYRDTPLIDVAIKLAYALPWLVLIGGTATVIIASWRSPGNVATQRLGLLVLLAIAFRAAFNLPHDWVHLLVLYPPTLLLGIALASRLRPPGRLRVATVVALGGAATASACLALSLRERYSAPVLTPRGALYARPAQAADLNTVLRAITAAPGGPLAALPYFPLLNFLAARPGLSRYYLVWPIERDVNRDAEIIDRLEATTNALVIYSPRRYPELPPFHEYAEPLFAYLVNHYTVGRSIGGDPFGFPFLVLERATPVAGRSLMGDALAAARVSLEQAGIPPREMKGSERAALVREVRWPFGHVLRVTPPSGSAVAIYYGVTAATGLRLITSYGINPALLGDFVSAHARFAIDVRDELGEHQLVSTDVGLVPQAGGSSWRRSEIDLTPWAGRSIELVLRVSAPPEATANLDLFGWMDPRLVNVEPAGSKGPECGP
jgi:4-amino-4-deoxy-L-arabinose transferase-like glycosyltransferase